MAILTNEPVQIIRGLKADIAQRTGSDGELNWATDSKELYIHDGKTRGGHLIGSAGGSTVITGGAGIAVSTVDGNSTISIKRDPSSVLYATTDGAGVRLGNSGGLQVTAQNALDLHLAEGGGLVVDSNGLKVDSSVLTSVFRYAGQVNSADDLPDDASIGDVYDVKDSGVNYVWTGSSWDNLGGILSVDPSPTQGSTNPVASGGVYDAIQAAKLSGDGKTVTVTSNTITAKDIAIGGDESDLASASGLLGKCVYATTTTNPDFDIDTRVFDTALINVATDIPGTFPAGVAGWCVVVQYNHNRTSTGSRVQLLYNVAYGGFKPGRAYIRYYWSSLGGWTDWNPFLTAAQVGDGITVNNGIISVPEYEGATADTAATSGLVPPAAAGEQDKVLRGDGEWGEYLPTAGGYMDGTIYFNDAAGTFRGRIYGNNDGTNGYVHLVANQNGGYFSVVDNSENSSEIDRGSFVCGARNADGTVNKTLRGRTSGVLSWDGKNIVCSVNGVTADISGNVDLASQFDGYLPLAGGTMTGAINRCLAFGRGVALTGSTIEVGSYNVFYKNITANTTFTMGAFPSGTSGIVFFTLILDEPGSHVITWPSNWQWGGDSTPPEMGRRAIINVVTSDNGATYFPTLAYNRG